MSDEHDGDSASLRDTAEAAAVDRPDMPFIRAFVAFAVGKASLEDVRAAIATSLAVPMEQWPLQYLAERPRLEEMAAEDRALVAWLSHLMSEFHKPKRAAGVPPKRIRPARGFRRFH
jgi:hypothetical protein